MLAKGASGPRNIIDVGSYLIGNGMERAYHLISIHLRDKRLIQWLRHYNSIMSTDIAAT